MENIIEISKKMESIARRYRSDSEFRAQVDADPAAALRSEGCGELAPEGASVNLHLDDEKTVHIVFPPVANLEAAADEGLEQVAGGFGCMGMTSTPLSRASIISMQNRFGVGEYTGPPPRDP